MATSFISKLYSIPREERVLTTLRFAKSCYNLHSRDIAEIVPYSELKLAYILRAVQVSNGNRVMAAKLLGIGKSTVYRHMKLYTQELMCQDRNIRQTEGR